MVSGSQDINSDIKGIGGALELIYSDICELAKWL
jgi:hypothetical protein